jgi:ribosomal protein S6--L-glutamate ligase
MGLRIAGVDLLESDDGPKVMEVNSSPGLEGIETATGLDVAGAVIDYLAAQVNFPELDIRQRLTVSRGYGVAELSIPEGSEYVGKTIQESGLREKDINVLTLHRETTVIPNPRPARVLEAGDRLLCFGKLESMRDLVSDRTRRARQLRIRHLASHAAHALASHSAHTLPASSNGQSGMEAASSASSPTASSPAAPEPPLAPPHVPTY